MQAPAYWQTVDFISDLHLQVQEPETAKAWFDVMASPEHHADALFILGDWFELWVGDDDDDPFAALCASVMRQKAKRCDLFVMRGNRDFLLGHEAIDRCHATLVEDPLHLEFKGHSYLLSHGDALCTDDLDYMRFRDLVRSPAWQSEFLAKPLDERKAIARQLRLQSQQTHATKTSFADVNPALALQWLDDYSCDTLIHGHTHEGKTYPLGKGLRHVLSDWDATAKPKRLQVLRLSSDGVRRIEL